MELIKALVALVPVSMLLSGSLILFARRKTVGSCLQLLGGVGLAIVVLTHVAETLGLFPCMRWGFKDSPGHYLDLLCATVGFTLFPVGYLMHAVRMCADEKDEQKL